ncbi:MAG TPA: sigma-54 dependent transcriptional regulator [Longimicrobiales bacterium]|nr:sigma-54 dependent transcriptional regulator [Longimicrobiales bacterium]
MADARILVVDDDTLLRTIIAERLERQGHRVAVAGSLAEAHALLRQGAPDVALLDVKLPDGEGTSLLTELVQELDVQCVMMTAHATVQLAVAALKLGARDFMEKPFSLDRMEATVSAALEVTELRREVRALREVKNGDTGDVIGSSPAMRQVLDLVQRLATANGTTVLIQGETGTGKGVIARLIHRLSHRANGPMVTLTCSALAETLMESEIFGHEKGAFTDARAMKRGMVELADRGTLFLDAIGELSPRLQSKLLQFIEDRSFRRVGGTRDLSVDVRVIAATNRNLEREVQAGNFRADLYYRLRVVPIMLPPLRERTGDIPLLAKTFIDHYNREMSRKVRRIAPDALDVLLRYEWPGNVRELRNVIERAVLLAEGEVLGKSMLPPELCAAHLDDLDSGVELGPDGLDIEALERTLLQQALVRAGGNRTTAGRLLGLSRHQIRNRLKKYGDEV